MIPGGELADPEHCLAIIARIVDECGKIDILMNNAAYQMSPQSINEITNQEWDYTFDVNIGAMFRLTKAAVPHMKPGSAIGKPTSINAAIPKPTFPASDEATYISGATVAVTGGKPLV